MTFSRPSQRTMTPRDQKGTKQGGSPKEVGESHTPHGKGWGEVKEKASPGMKSETEGYHSEGEKVEQQHCTQKREYEKRTTTVCGKQVRTHEQQPGEGPASDGDSGKKPHREEYNISTVIQ
ncbi:hypothetical protein NDU88_006041 [Pleurodeles waltl]|uniref:Uncharacterized protein n=1 Tax=Pleurodeles waltl TaxID=8319 RepID=A0AAV7TWL4_PLEWA|nr:hypothetical protein NDU88_006041 [Pleurodeles waltl]